MVSYYGPAAMYRHQQAMAAQPGQFHPSGSPMHSWYSGSYHPQGQMAPTPSYCMQEEQQWHHHSVFHQDYAEFHPGHPGGGHATPGHPAGQLGHHGPLLEAEAQLPSPPITVSGGSDMSSPGAPVGTASPHQDAVHHLHHPHPRPPPARSPYEWIKKTPYVQQTPELEAGNENPESLLLDFASQDYPGKTRTKDKYRVVYTDHQRVELEKEFYYSRYITIRRKSELAANLGLSERQVKIWFQNRRAKDRKQMKKREELHQKDQGQSLMGHQHAMVQQNQHPVSVPQLI